MSKGDDGLKLVLCGDVSVGKTNLMLRFTAGPRYKAVSQATLGTGFGSHTVDVDGRMYRAHIWDTAGQEQFRTITTLYYRGAAGALLVYDITRRETFDDLPMWYGDVLKNCTNPQMVVAIVGNKLDLVTEGLAQRQVLTSVAEKYAEENNLLFWEASAYDDVNVTAAFEGVIRRIVEVMPPPAPVPGLTGCPSLLCSLGVLLRDGEVESASSSLPRAMLSHSSRSHDTCVC